MPNNKGMTNKNAEKIIKLLGGVCAVAKRLGIKPPSVSGWLKDGIPKDKLIILALDIERLSKGKYTRKSLLPDCYAEIWPELKEVA